VAHPEKSQIGTVKESERICRAVTCGGEWVDRDGLSFVVLVQPDVFY